MSSKVQLRVEDEFGNHMVLSVSPWSSVQHIKETIASQFQAPVNSLRLFSQGAELANRRTLLDYQFEDSAKIFVKIANSDNEVSLEVFGDSICDESCKKLIIQARQGLAHHLAPKLTIDGTGGTYFLRNAKKMNVAVFKPADEEPFAPNNPRGYVGKEGQPGLRPGILSGEGCLREVAAYLVDHGHFANVPATVRVEIFHDAFNYNVTSIISKKSKVGSLQEFVDFDDIAGDIGPQKFSAREVQKIGLLDIRILNTDRNDANILVKRKGRNRYDLIPIDHGYSFPSVLKVDQYDWVWFEWPQTKVPFDEETKTYVKSWDAEADINLLRTLGIRSECLRLVRMSYMVLQKGVAAGLTLHQIASMYCRSDDENRPSELEILLEQAEKLASLRRRSTLPTARAPVRSMSFASLPSQVQEEKKCDTNDSLSSLDLDPPLPKSKDRTPSHSQSDAVFTELCKLVDQLIQSKLRKEPAPHPVTPLLTSTLAEDDIDTGFTFESADTPLSPISVSFAAPPLSRASSSDYDSSPSSSPATFSSNSAKIKPPSSFSLNAPPYNSNNKRWVPPSPHIGFTFESMDTSPLSPSLVPVTPFLGAQASESDWQAQVSAYTPSPFVGAGRANDRSPPPLDLGGQSAEQDEELFHSGSTLSELPNLDAKRFALERPAINRSISDPVWTGAGARPPPANSPTLSFMAACNQMYATKTTLPSDASPVGFLVSGPPASPPLFALEASSSLFSPQLTQPPSTLASTSHSPPSFALDGSSPALPPVAPATKKYIPPALRKKMGESGAGDAVTPLLSPAAAPSNMTPSAPSPLFLATPAEPPPVSLSPVLSSSATEFSASISASTASAPAAAASSSLADTVSPSSSPFSSSLPPPPSPSLSPSVSLSPSASPSLTSQKKYIPPHLRKRMQEQANATNTESTAACSPSSSPTSTPSTPSALPPSTPSISPISSLPTDGQLAPDHKLNETFQSLVISMIPPLDANAHPVLVAANQ